MSLSKLGYRLVRLALLGGAFIALLPERVVHADDLPDASTAPIRWDGQFLPQVNAAQFGGKLGKIRPVRGDIVQPTLGGYRELAASKAPTFLAPTQAAAAGDVVNLDELIPIDNSPIRTAALTTETIPPGNEIVESVQPKLPPGTREGVFQKLLFTATWAPRLSEQQDTLGVWDLETGVVFGFPMLRRDTPLLVTPRFGVHLFENAAVLDLPSRVYDASAEFRHMRKFGDGPWAMDVAATVGYYSDFQIDSGDAVRVSGRGLAVYESSPAAKWIVGVAYLNRAGATVLPVAGVIYERSSDVRWELIFPRPRLVWKAGDPSAGRSAGDQRWWYVGGEFGGGVWAIERRSTAMLDLVSYSDLRLMVGHERKIVGGLNRRYEFGYVFNREVEYRSATPDATLDDAIFLRAGLTY